MTKKGTLLATAAILALGVSSRSAIIINEIYSGGGASSGSPAYKTDFVELYNNGTLAVDVTGFRLDYGSSAQPAGTFPSAIGTFGAITAFGVAPIIPAGGYLLIQTGSSGTAGATDVAPDFDFGSIGLAASSGAVRLEDASFNILDIVGWGSALNFETAAVASPASTAVSMQRATLGLDTNNNSADFNNSSSPTPIALAPEPTTAIALLGGTAFLTGIIRRRRS